METKENKLSDLAKLVLDQLVKDTEEYNVPKYEFREYNIHLYIYNLLRSEKYKISANIYKEIFYYLTEKQLSKERKDKEEILNLLKDMHIAFHKVDTSALKSIYDKYNLPPAE